MYYIKYLDMFLQEVQTALLQHLVLSLSVSSRAVHWLRAGLLNRCNAQPLTYRPLKSLVGFLRLDFIFLTEGIILDVCYEMWE
jgi:hypothetical protein